MLKYVLLALIDSSPRHGYELKAAFENLLGGTWRLNIGQVYTVLSRLEQDGMVANEVVPQDLLPDRKVYALTDRGRQELSAWLASPVSGLVRPRDEVFIRVILQLAIGSDAMDLLWAQRQSYLETMAQLERLRGDSDSSAATALLLDGLLLRLEADMRWLDLCEERVRDTV